MFGICTLCVFEICLLFQIWAVKLFFSLEFTYEITNVFINIKKDPVISDKLTFHFLLQII